MEFKTIVIAGASQNKVAKSMRWTNAPGQGQRKVLQVFIFLYFLKTEPLQKLALKRISRVCPLFQFCFLTIVSAPVSFIKLV